jgi:MFS family permease
VGKVKGAVMIEAYSFLAAFMVQILVVSVLNPVWVTRYARAKGEAQLPGWDRKSRERFLSLYRAVNTGIAVLGLVLLGWLFSHMRSPDWDVGPVTHLLAGYVVVQILPFVLLSLIAGRFRKKALTHSLPEVKRTASLQRRGLFDIVSPFTVFLAVLAYVLFAAFVIYIEQHPFPGFTGYRLLGIVTLVYLWNAFFVYWTLYRRKRWPLETPAYRMQAVGVQVKILFYTSIAFMVFAPLSVTLRLFHLQRWAPFAVSVFIVIITLICSVMFFALRRQAEADRLASIPAS